MKAWSHGIAHPYRPPGPPERVVYTAKVAPFADENVEDWYRGDFRRIDIPAPTEQDRQLPDSRPRQRPRWLPQSPRRYLALFAIAVLKFTGIVFSA